MFTIQFTIAVLQSVYKQEFIKKCQAKRALGFDILFTVFSLNEIMPPTY